MKRILALFLLLACVPAFAQMGSGTGSFGTVGAGGGGSAGSITTNVTGTLIVASGTNLVVTGVTSPTGLNSQYWLTYTNAVTQVAVFTQYNGTNVIVFNDPGNNQGGLFAILLESVSNAVTVWADGNLPVNPPQTLNNDVATGTIILTILNQTNSVTSPAISPNYPVLGPYQPNSSVTYLSTNGNDYLGSVGGYPFKTWYYAQAAAGTRGGIVHIEPGNTTLLSVTSNNIVVEGESIDSTLLNASGASITDYAYSNTFRNFSVSTALFSEGYGWATYDHLYLSGGADALYLQDGTNLVINCVLFGNGWDSLAMVGANNCVIKNTTIKSRYTAQTGNSAFYCRGAVVGATGSTNYFIGDTFDVYGGRTNACLEMDSPETVIIEGCTMIHGGATNNSFGVEQLTTGCYVYGHWTDNGVPMLGLGTNIIVDAFTLQNTNLIDGKLYTNFTGTVETVSASPVWVVAGVAGAVNESLQIFGSATNTCAATTLVTSIAMTYTNSPLVGFIPPGGVFCYTNLSSGAGNSARITGGQIKYP